MNSINWEARVRRLAEGAKWATGDEITYEQAVQAQGTIPPHVMPRLASFAQRLGYPVKLGYLPDGILGQTHHGNCDCGHHNGEKAIVLLDGMSAASTARVLGHEIGHAITNVSETTEDRWLSRQMNGNPGGEDIAEEVAAELGSAAFWEAQGIDTTGFLHRYMGMRLAPGQTTPEHVIRKAARNARALWEAAQS